MNTIWFWFIKSVPLSLLASTWKQTLTSCSDSVPDNFLSLPLEPAPPFLRPDPGFRPLGRKQTKNKIHERCNVLYVLFQYLGKVHFGEVEVMVTRFIDWSESKSSKQLTTHLLVLYWYFYPSFSLFLLGKKLLAVWWESFFSNGNLQVHGI